MRISDGAGGGFKAKVNKQNKLETEAVSVPSSVNAAEMGDAYNINTGDISFTAAGTLLYIKNNEEQDLIVEAVAMGVNNLGTHSDIGNITVISNPTNGDLISDATAVDINANRNFGSAQVLDASVFKGKSGGTVTGGNDAIYIFQGNNGRLFATIDMIVPKGSSLAVTYDPKLSSGTATAYCAIICHLRAM